MLESLRLDIVGRLTDSEFEGKTSGSYIRKIRCPDCHKREAYVHAESPWMVLCGRRNQCSARWHVKDLFPELFESPSERYAPKVNEPPNPLAVAQGYLRDHRGFDLSLVKGLYTQEYFHNDTLDAGTATVRFTLPGGATWERLLDRPHRFGKQKANFRGKYKGEAWHLHPTKTLAELAEVWIVEGIFDAIALWHHGIHAVAAMSCANFPQQFLEHLRDACHKAKIPKPTLVWALDNNRAGQDGIEGHIPRASALGWDSTAAQPPPGYDWNDLHQRKRLAEADVDRYRYYGALLLAPSPTAKGQLIYGQREQRAFWFEHKAQLYWFKLDGDKFEKSLKNITGDDDAENRQPTDAERDEVVQQAATVARICTAYPTALYYQQNSVTDESWYYWRVESPAGGVIKNTFNGGQLSSASEFKKRMLGVSPGAVWTGSSGQLDRLLQDQVGQIKTVETIDFIGYSRAHGAYVLGDLAIARGRVYRMTAEDYFDFGRLRLKTLSQSVALAINPDREQFQRAWIHNLIGAYGSTGVVALAFWLGALFAEQIRSAQKSFPFLEIVGEPSTGKSTLIEFMWKLVGRIDYEGFDPAKASMPARARNFAQVSNLPVVLIESDRDTEGGAKQKQFDWDELKTAYNGRSIRARGVKNAGNETYEPPFRGAIVISQNAEVQASPAIQSRICHIKTTKHGQTPQTKEMAEALERVSVENVSGFILEAGIRESAILKIIAERMPSYESALLADPDIRALRIAKNHGQLMALVDALGTDCLGLIDAETHAQAMQRVMSMARERQQAINADHPMVEEFWEAYDYIESIYQGAALNHYGERDPKGRIAINLKDFEATCRANNLHSVPPTKEIKRYLAGSRSRKFLESNRSVRSRIRETTVRCWVFAEAAAGGAR